MYDYELNNLYSSELILLLKTWSNKLVCDFDYAK